MSPKFKSFDERDDEKINNQEERTDKDDEYRQYPIKTSINLDMSNESSNQRNIRGKNSKNSSSQFRKSPEAEKLDYKEQLRKSLEAGSKKQTSVQIRMSINDEHERNDKQTLSPIGSDNDTDSHAKPEYLMSPLNENYKDIDEFTKHYKQKQQEMLEEFNSMHQDTFNLVHQFDKFARDVEEEHSEEEDQDDNSQSLRSINLSN